MQALGRRVGPWGGGENLTGATGMSALHISPSL